MTLIGHAHSSKFMEWQNLGITTLQHAKCTSNVLKKMPENRITTNFIYLTSSNFVTISHINYCDQVNAWKNLWKFWNGPLCRNKSSTSPYSMLQDIGRVATPKLVSTNCLRYLQTTLIMGGAGIGLRIYLRYSPKKLMKDKMGFGKAWHFFYLKPTILDLCDMSNGFTTNWLTP